MGNKRKIWAGLLSVYLISTLVFVKALPTAADGSGLKKFEMNPTNFGVLCLSSVYPGAVEGLADSRDNEEAGDHAGERLVDAGKQDENGAVQAKAEEEETNPVIFGDDPAVLIVHTHATETYLPASAGNYHSKKKENSVRDVGEVLAKSLEEEGISVIHDQTLHDNPSYNNSYNRSYETIEKLLKKYPTITCVIDLHRDAIASDAPGSTISVNGKTCARYMYVVGAMAPNYQTNLKFVKALNQTATKTYDGYTGNVLERGYQYNQNLSDKSILLEIGNNRNDITEVRNCAKVFGKILADTLKAGH